MKNYPKEVRIVEVGPRDGLQNESQIVSSENKIQLIKLLSESGLKNIEVTSFVNPKNIPQLQDAEEIIKNLKLNSHISYSALVPNMKGFERALESGIKHIAIFTAASETFNKKNINMAIDESIENYKEIVKLALGKNISVRAYISTCFVCPYEGEIKIEKVNEITNKLLEFGVYEVSIGDTIGAACPVDVYKLLEVLLKSTPKEKIALHFHDTYGTALANVISGLDCGISIFDSSCGGLGGCPYANGASGNLATEDLVYMLEKMKINTGVDLLKITKASSFIQNILQKKLPSKQLQRLDSLYSV